MTRYYHCGECDQVVDAKYAKNHPKGKLDYLFATDDKDKQDQVDKLQDSDEDEEKKKKNLEAYKASLRGKSMSELNSIHDDLEKELEDMKKGKTESKEAKRKRRSVLGYDNSLYNYNLVAGDCLMKDLGSVD